MLSQQYFITYRLIPVPASMRPSIFLLAIRNLADALSPFESSSILSSLRRAVNFTWVQHFIPTRCLNGRFNSEKPNKGCLPWLSRNPNSTLLCGSPATHFVAAWTPASNSSHTISQLIRRGEHLLNQLFLRIALHYD